MPHDFDHMNLSFTCKHFDDLSLKELYDSMVLRQEIFVVEQNCAFLDADGSVHVSSEFEIARLNGGEIGELVWTAGLSRGAASDLTRIGIAQGKLQGSALAAASPGINCSSIRSHA